MSNNNFKRGLEDKFIENLCQLSKEKGSWWRDLLDRSLIPGSKGETDRKLRIAVRNNYLNFYYLGQSVAQVIFVYGKPYIKVHEKYLKDNTTDQKYIRIDPLDPECWGIKTLTDVINKAKKYTGTEKEALDNIITHNSDIVDMEITLPSPKGAKRMDMTRLLTKSQGSYKLQFIEAKMIGNKELVSTSTPKIVDQLKNYRDYLLDLNNQQSIKSAYAKNCHDLDAIFAMANSGFKNRYRDVTENNIEIDPEPILIIFDDGCASKNIETHLKKLEDNKIKLRRIRINDLKLLELPAF